jgi:hypothetical protein
MTGVDVLVQPIDPTTGTQPITTEFSDVTGDGITTVESFPYDQGPPPPTNFRLKSGGDKAFYEISTTATFEGTVKLCFYYNDGDFLDENAIVIQHWNDETEVWDPVANLERFPAENKICGEVTSFSIFGLFEPTTPPQASITTPSAGTIVSTANPVTFTGVIVDPDEDDSHTATWIFTSAGESSSVSGIVTPILGGAMVTASVTFATPGIYQISLIVIDSFGGTDTVTTVGDFTAFVVIFDPDGSHVTGGGWINSPIGAYTPDPDLTGKASFGFVAKYVKGTTTPTGETEFLFKAGDLEFYSDNYEWLVVAGARAMFKGTGTINGEGEYKFMITAIDGKLQGGGGADKFRIKIWLEDDITGEETIIYDNMLGAEEDAELGVTTLLGGGSIVIHKK